MEKKNVTISVEELEKAYKKAERREKIQEKVSDAKNWCHKNKETILMLAPGVIGVAAAAVKAIGKRVNLVKEKNIKDTYCYDRSLGHYWSLKRELSNAEWVEIDKRKRNGERLSDILESLKVLK